MHSKQAIFCYYETSLYILFTDYEKSLISSLFWIPIQKKTPNPPVLLKCLFFIKFKLFFLFSECLGYTSIKEKIVRRRYFSLISILTNPGSVFSSLHYNSFFAPFPYVITLLPWVCKLLGLNITAFISKLWGL